MDLNDPNKLVMKTSEDIGVSINGNLLVQDAADYVILFGITRQETLRSNSLFSSGDIRNEIILLRSLPF